MGVWSLLLTHILYFCILGPKPPKLVGVHCKQPVLVNFLPAIQKNVYFCSLTFPGMYGNKSVTCEKFLFLTTIFLTYAVVESHPDSTHPDLRLDRPFPGLVQYVDALDLNTMTKQVIIVCVRRHSVRKWYSHWTLDQKVQV